MTILQRAAAIAAMSLAITGLGISATGNAAETAKLAELPIPSALTSINTRIPVPVPALVVPAVIPAPLALPATPLVAPIASFASLAAAVAAHETAGAAGDEAHCLAGAIYFESKGEPLHGQLGVAEVIMNRAKSGRFAADICAVVTQRGQFSFVRGGRIPAIDQGRAAYRTALAVARVALADLWDSPASNALYFNARRAPAAGLRRVATIGNHMFYR